MLELLALFGLVVAGLAALALLAVVVGLLKVTFKLLMLPLALLWGLVKVAGVAALLLAALLLAPVLLGLLLLALPLLLIAGLLGLGWAVVAA